MSIVLSFVEAPAAQTTVEPSLDYLVHRALRPDARFGYITVGSRAARARAVDRAADPLPIRSGEYEVCHQSDEAAPAYDPQSAAQPVMFINALVVDPGKEDDAFAAWARVNRYMVRQPGYQWHKLHRRIDDSAPFAFVNVVRWESAAAWEAAHDDGFRALTNPAELPFVPMPTLCELVDSMSAVAD